MNKSQVFTKYNQMRVDGNLDPKRVNKALGIAQAKTPRPYNTTTVSCTCPDALRHHTCKHMLAARMTTPQAPRKAPIAKVVFEPTRDIMKLIEGDWQATITRTDGTEELVYRSHMPAETDPKMAAANLVYTGHNGRKNTYTWKRKEG